MQAEVTLMAAIDLWKSDFGNDYTERNVQTTLNARQNLWEALIPIDCESILEVGANIGLNLEAISNFHDCELFACEPNEVAREKLRRSDFIDPHNITADTADRLQFKDNAADLVFTSGVLIHIPTDKLIKSMSEIHRCARRWIICAEYFAPSEEMIPYRGQDNALWRRDYGSLYLDNFNDLRCTANVFAWKRKTGLDNLTIWVFEKGPKAN
jgi:pseudaminic acid biosynthesis-associated methylase